MPSEFEWFNIAHFLIVSLIFGTTIGIVIDNGLSHVLLIDGGKLITSKMPIAGVGWLAYFLDTEGNMTGIMQRDDSAK